jgi:hypothetical protein
VGDAYGVDPKTCHNIRISECSADYGHNGSQLYGGGEYNAGAWLENCAHVHVLNFTAKNMPVSIGRGLVMVSGTQNNGAVGPAATFAAANLRFENTGIGVVAYSQGAFPVSVSIENVQAYGVFQGVNFQPKLAEDNFSCTGGYVDIDFSLNPNVTLAYSFFVTPGLASKPVVSFTDCMVSHTNENVANLTGYYTLTSCADVGAFAGNTATNGARLVLRNIRNTKGTPIWIGIPENNACDLQVSESYVRIAYAAFLGAGSAVFDNCRIHSAQVGNGSAARVEFKGGSIEGPTRAGGDFVRVTGSIVNVGGADSLWLFSSAANNKPGIFVDSTSFSKDIAANGAPLRFGFGNASFTAVVSDSHFYNSGNASANPCITHSFGANVVYSSVLKDSTVESMSAFEDGSGAVALPAGVTAATFH